jgi:hypothetical protein
LCGKDLLWGHLASFPPGCCKGLLAQVRANGADLLLIGRLLSGGASNSQEERAPATGSHIKRFGSSP